MKKCETCEKNDFCKDKAWYRWAGGKGLGCWRPVGQIKITQECEYEEDSVKLGVNT
jgi:hypothetical protein